MRYGTVCSGIEAASVALGPLGWDPVFFAEVEPFCCAVLSHHYPDVPNVGDLTQTKEADVGAIDLLIAGTPCQSFSVAGQRAGLADPRGHLTLELFSLVNRLRPRWLVWENVPGLLSDDGGRTFGTCLGLLADCGYGFAYRVLDAEWFGVPQRRHRVFLVGYRGDWRPPAAVLFERTSLSGHPAPRREAREDIAACLEAGTNHTGGTRPPGTTVDTVTTLVVTETAASLTASTGHHGYSSPRGDGTDNLVAFHGKASAHQSMNPAAISPTLDKSKEVVIAFADQPGKSDTGEGPMLVQEGMVVRRLTPRECERLQGLPDDWTLVPYRGKPAKDAPRYRAIGNSFAVPVVRWIGQRLQHVDHLLQKGFPCVPAP